MKNKGKEDMKSGEELQVDVKDYKGSEVWERMVFSKNGVELKGKWQIEADEEKGSGHERS